MTNGMVTLLFRRIPLHLDRHRVAQKMASTGLDGDAIEPGSLGSGTVGIGSVLRVLRPCCVARRLGVKPATVLPQSKDFASPSIFW